SLQWTAGSVCESIVEDPITSANDGLVPGERIPRETHPRHELVIINGSNPRRHAGIARKKQALRRVRVNGRLLTGRPRIQTISNFRVWRVYLIAESEVQGQPL